MNDTKFKKGEKAPNWNGFRKGHKPLKPFTKGHPHGKRFKKGDVPPKTAFKKGLIPWNKGKVGECSEETINKMRDSHLGYVQSIEQRKKTSERQKGDKSHFWVDGRTKVNKIIRNSIEYRLWREAVFKRDDWTCVWCSVKGGKLHADHIKPFALFPELRFAIDNGRTLCVPCHRTTDTFGKRTKVIIIKQL